ncbi:hypothetical protein FXO38_03779 [Capsicum annuum]|nr:hypothetical protein FXO37_13041 [Capsicum annuum]KAF3677483.1 hypothetical protein FXO38_03779 [Capsicum annuum]
MMSGRPNKCRRNTRNLSKYGVDMTCIICHAKGLKRVCSLATSSTRSSVDYSTAPSINSGRGRPKGSTKAVGAAIGRGRGFDATVTIGSVGRGRGYVIVVTLDDVNKEKGVITSTINGAGRGRGASPYTISGNGRSR